MKHNALKAAFPYTIPVLLGYIFLGIAFGILLLLFFPWPVLSYSCPQRIRKWGNRKC